MSSVLYCDFETRSRCDLRAHGVYNYAQHPSTDVLCMSWAFDDDEVQTWLPGQPFPEEVRNHTGQIRAHNAAFERLVFWYVLQIDYDLEQFYCTATQARANCAPGSLEDAGRFAGAAMRKDRRGSQLVRALCIPRPDGTFNNDPALMSALVEYCERDVRAMRAISQGMRQLSDTELADYHVNERINDAGVLVDVPLAQAAMRYAAAELEEIQALVAEVTNGEVMSVRSPRMREWVWERVGPQARDLMMVTKGEDTKKSIDKNVRASLLVLAEENPDEVPHTVADVVQCADDLWASSVAKFARMADLADEEDHRVRGAFVFAGGAATGRAASYGLQAHNLGRKTAKDPEAVRHAMVRGHQIIPQFGKRVTDVLKGMLRPSLMAAPGSKLVVADWSAIEARVNPWLSNCAAGDAKLDLFRTGEDIYKVNASATFGVGVADVDDAQRQVGKVQELACIAEDTMVWTSNGLKAIVDVQLSDKLWDGDQWVSHQGVVSRGVKPTISVCGMSVTEDHLLLVKSGWLDAKTVLSSKKYQTQALAIGLATSPSWGRQLRSTRAAWYLSSALAAQNLTPSISTTCVKVPPRGATPAPRKRPGTGEKTISNTLTPVPMTTIGGGFLTACRPARTAATIRKTLRTPTTVGGVSPSTSLGGPTKPLSCGMSSRLRGGMNHVSNWIASTWTRATSRVTCGSSHAKPTWETGVRSKTCKPDAMPLRRVYDIAHAGPNNRFMVATPEGQVIVHNCGFGGSVGAFNAMGRVYGVLMPEAQSRRMVEAWRRANPWAVDQWSALERAYTIAMRQPGHEFTAGRITYLYDRQHLWYALPSGRVLCYPHARFDRDGITYAKAAWKPAQDAKEWPRARLWRGLAVENCWTGDTLALTLSGWRPIADILPTDLLWDGEAWVAHDGVVCNGEQEIVRWAGTRVTPNHQIYDGTHWRAVIDLDGPTTDGCLSLGRSLEPKRSSPSAASDGSTSGAAAGVFGQWIRGACAATSRLAGLARLPLRQRKSDRTSSRMTGSAPSGCTAEPAQSLGATPPLTRHGPTTVGAVSPYMNLGGATLSRGWHTLSPFLGGTSSGWTSTGSTTTETMRPATCGSYRGVPTPTTEAALLSLNLAANGCLSQSSGGSIVPAGEATTRSRTTSDAVALAMKSPRFTGERAVVYDIVNAGPRHRYMVLTPLGPVIAHNCVQAVANDLLRDALRRLDAAGHRVILHVHDEIVLEADDVEAAAAQLEAVMVTPPAWAAGLPLAAEVNIRERYGK